MNAPFIPPATLARIVPGFASGVPHDPAARGYCVVYDVGDPPDCPGCGRSHWLVGRTLAECAVCSTALPIRDGAMTHYARPVVVKRSDAEWAR
jgi:hypothetical protein